MGDLAGCDLCHEGPPDLARFSPPDLARPAGSTGDPCMAATDCLGAHRQCLAQHTMLGTWPDGYCSSTCDPATNDPATGLSSDCTGGDATCLDNGGPQGLCVVACAAPMSCPRMGYSCFGVSASTGGCLPTSLSQCNPDQPAPGGCRMTQKCFPAGYDPVGFCLDRCDPFAMGGCRMMMGAECVVDDMSGDGVCSQGGGGQQGDPCQSSFECSQGFACEGGTCGALCGGPAMRACVTGQMCSDFSASVPRSKLGVCH